MCTRLLLRHIEDLFRGPSLGIPLKEDLVDHQPAQRHLRGHAAASSSTKFIKSYPHIPLGYDKEKEGRGVP
jgi:hypothetical protein